MLKEIWFIGIICSCLALSVGILNSEAISKQTKTKIEYWYEFIEKFGEYQPELKWKTVYEYDSAGNKMKETHYSSEIGLLSTTTSEYDEKGDKVGEETKHPWKRELDKKIYEYKYDEKRNKIEVSEYDEKGKLRGKWVYKYDEKGNEIEATYHDLAHGMFDCKVVYDYDERGNRIEEIEYNINGELRNKWTFEYDEKGREIKKAKYNEKDELEGKWTSEYDEKGREIKRTGYDSEGNKIIVRHRKYDEDGNEVENISYEYKSVSGEIQEVPDTKRVYEYFAKEDEEIIFSGEEPKAGPYTFRKTTWGMPYEQVKDIEKSGITYDTEEMLVYEGRLAGLACDIIYIFAEGKLVRTKYLITEKHSNENDYISDYDSLKESLTKKYGQPIIDEHNWKNDLYEDDYQRWGFAVSIGHLSYYAMWKTLQTSIVLVLQGDNYDITLGIEYGSEELKELEERQKEKELLEEF